MQFDVWQVKTPEVTMRSFIALGIAVAFSSPLMAGKIVLVAGGGEGPEGTPAKTAKIVAPFGVDFDSKGQLYFVEMAKGERLRTIDSQGDLITLAGTGEKGAISALAQNGATVKFNGLHALAIGELDVIYVADTFNYAARIYLPTNATVMRFIGTDEKGFAGDGGPAINAKFGQVIAICFDAAKENLFIADIDNRRIRKVELAKKTFIVSTVAGTGKKGMPADGKKAVDEPLLDPRAVAMDKDQNLYILERSGHCLRVVNKDGIVRTVGGTGKAGTAVGKALESQMNGPKHLCIDKDSSVLIADTENHRILRYLPKEEKIVVVAGTGKKGSAGLDGDPLKAELNQPHGVTIHPKTGELYICDSSNNRILRIVQ
jgi:hypothetical protein